MRKDRFNLNHHFRVKLTAAGIAELRRQHEELRTVAPSIGEFIEPHIDENGYYREQAWVLFSELGHLFHNGMAADQPFSPEIIIEFDEPPAQSTIDKLLQRLKDMRDFCYGETRPHPANVQRLCDDVLDTFSKLGVGV